MNSQQNLDKQNPLTDEDFMKSYHFIFKGHEYTVVDSARHQGRCPHCDNKAKDGFMYDAYEDKEAFIGYYKVDEDNYILCFECPKCFEKFYYHMPKVGIVFKRLPSKITEEI